MAENAPVAGSPRLVLGSASPRRAELLAMLGLEFDVDPAGVEERLKAGEPPAITVERLAREKAQEVAARHTESLVIGADTVVLSRRGVLGKPSDAADAETMLMELQGREHRVMTGVAVIAPGGRVVSSAEIARVRFRSFGEDTAREYIATGEPMDKAGAYGIQGYGATLVDYIEGDFFAVMGLPLARTVSLFRALGWRYNFRGFAPLGR